MCAGSMGVLSTYLLKNFDLTLILLCLFFTVCVMNGTEICFPINANCSGGTLPEFIINQEHYLFQNVYFNMSLAHFDITYSSEQSRTICFRNIRTNIRFIEFCLLHSDCTSFQSSDDEELVIEKKIEIDVRSGK